MGGLGDWETVPFRNFPFILDSWSARLPPPSFSSSLSNSFTSEGGGGGGGGGGAGGPYMN